MKAFSLLEAMVGLLLTSLVCAAVMMGIVSIRKQNLASSRFVHERSKLAETRLFLNNYFFLALPNSFSITPTNVKWSGYDRLHVPSRGDVMGFDTSTRHYELSLRDGALFFNDDLLLRNVNSISFLIRDSAAGRLLMYEICQRGCASDMVILQDSVIRM